MSFVLYEHPFNEKIRTLLRLEDLFDRFSFFLSQQTAQEHHAALMTLFEIADVSSRIDLKSDLLKELDRQRQTLGSYRDNPTIQQNTLEAVLTEIEQTLTGLTQIHGKAGQHLADNEWLGSIRSRAMIPGGTCKFDIPSYYAWQQKPFKHRHDDIILWKKPFLPLREAVNIILKLARASNQPASVTAIQGGYQQMLSGRSYQLMQMQVPSELGVIPEASANKHMLWVRFTKQDGHMRPQPVNRDIPFQLILCNL